MDFQRQWNDWNCLSYSKKRGLSLIYRNMIIDILRQRPVYCVCRQRLRVEGGHEQRQWHIGQPCLEFITKYSQVTMYLLHSKPDTAASFESWTFKSCAEMSSQLFPLIVLYCFEVRWLRIATSARYQHWWSSIGRTSISTAVGRPRIILSELLSKATSLRHQSDDMATSAMSSRIYVISSDKPPLTHRGDQIDFAQHLHLI